MMDGLPPDMVVRVLMQLEPEDLSRCDQLSRRFHGLTSFAEKALGLSLHIESDELLHKRFRLWYGQQRSLVEEALRRLATDSGYKLPKTVPSNHVNWTQALLFLAMLRRHSNRKRVAATSRLKWTDTMPFAQSSAFLDAGRTVLIRCGGQETRQNIPAPIAGFTGVCVQSIAASWRYTIVLAVDGTAYSWGWGGNGTLGHGDELEVTQPTRIRALSNVCAIATGEEHALAITADGSLWSWGTVQEDQKYLGHGDETLGESVMLPQRIESLAGLRICAVSAGSKHSLAACADRGFFSWGENTCHVLGLRSHELKLLPHSVFVELDEEEELYANEDEERAYASVPHRVHALRDERVTSCAASSIASYAVTAHGAIWRWGTLNGERATPATLVRTPLDGHRVVSVALSEVHALAVTADGAVLSWWTGNSRSDIFYETIRQRGGWCDLLGHGDAHDAPLECVCTPRRI